MATVNIYITFDGNCEEAFNFYKSVFGLPFLSFSRFNEMPPGDEGMSFSGEEGEKVMHASIKISEETVLMGSDTAQGFGPPYVQGNNFSVSITAESREEADRFFKELSAGGHQVMPMEDTFWGSYFGMVNDKFGINWMVGFDEAPQ